MLMASGIITILALSNVLIGKLDEWFAWVILGFCAPGIIVSEIQLHRPRPKSAHKNGYVVRRSAWTAICYMIVCAGWLIAVLNIGIHHPEADLVVKLLMFSCAAGLVVSFWRFVDPEPMIVIDERGYFDKSLEIGTIPWSKISGAKIVNHQGAEVISVEVTDQSILEPKQNLANRYKRKLDRLVGFELLHLGIVELDAAHIDQALDYVLSHCGGEAEPTVQA